MLYINKVKNNLTILQIMQELATTGLLEWLDVRHYSELLLWHLFYPEAAKETFLYTFKQQSRRN